MPMDEVTDERYDFGEFSLDARENLLRHGDRLIPLPAKVFDVLCMLVTRRGSVVSKDELMETVWADSFVEESNLTQSIYSLRRTLGKGPMGDHLIETLPKRGYRIAVPVTSGVDRRSESGIPAFQRSFFERHRNVIAASSAAMVLVLVTSLLGARYLSNRPSPPVENVKFQKLTFSGDISFPIISQDGKSFAYVKDEAIHLQDISTGSSVKLAVEGHKKFGNLQFSREGELIYFRTEDSFDAAGDVFQVSRFGGAAKIVAQHVWSTVEFSPDSRKIAFVRFLPTQGEWSLIIKEVATGEERKLFSCNLPYTIFRTGYPAWSPDGKQIAIVQQTPDQENVSVITLISVEAGKAETVKTPQLVQIEQVAWLPESRGLVVTGRENNRFFQLWRLDLPGGELRRITNDLNNYRTVSVSADGRDLLARQFSTYSHIWTAPANNLQDQRQITYGNLNRDGGSGIVWTPDRQIVYTTRITGNIDIWTVRPEDGVRKQLTENAGTNNDDPFVTADGKYIFFESTRSGKRRIWRIDANGSNPTQVSPDDENLDFLPVVSANGDMLYYIQRHSRSNVLWRQSLADGKREMMTQQGKLAPGGFLALSPDGRYLAFKSQRDESITDTADVVFFDLEGVDEPRVVTIRTQNPTIVWSDNGRSFDYVDNQPDAARMWRQPFEGAGERKLLLEIPKGRISAFAWSADSKMLALARGRQENDVILLTGF